MMAEENWLFAVLSILTSNNAIRAVQQIFKRMQFALFEDLMLYYSQKLDLELQAKCPPLLPSPTLTSLSSEYRFQEPPISDESFGNSEEEESHPETSKDEGFSTSIEISSTQGGPCKKSKPIKKRKAGKSNKMDSSQASASISEGKRGRKGKGIKVTYPTKNFLPNFKGPHLCFLERWLGDQVNNHPFVQYLRGKDGISLKDNQYLYKMEEFQQAFSAMFRCRYLYRELLLSRSDPETKKIHQRKLHVFEEAFYSKSFTKIN